MEALIPLAETGKKITLLRATNERNTKNADALIDGEKWEVKTNFTPTKSAIDNALHSCNGQSQNLVLNIKSEITEETLMEGIRSRLRRTIIERIIIIREGKIEKTLRRSDILK